MRGRVCIHGGARTSHQAENREKHREGAVQTHVGVKTEGKYVGRELCDAGEQGGSWWLVAAHGANRNGWMSRFNRTRHLFMK